MFNKKQDGFTLIETIFAFSILTLSLLLIFQIFSGISLGLRKSHDYVLAITLAQSKLHDGNLKENSEGVFQDRFHWQLSRRELEPSEIFGSTVYINTYKLYEYKVVITWKQNKKPTNVESSLIRVESR